MGSPALLPPIHRTRALGSGGVCDITECTDARGLRFVRKSPRAAYAVDPDVREQLVHESALLSALDHPRLIRWLGADAQASPPWLALEFLEGATLASRAAEHVGDIARCAQSLAGLLDCLVALHEATSLRAIHGDIAPGNFIHVPGRGWVLLDLGLARSTLPESPTGPSPLGTPSYAAPERIEHQAPPTVASDLWSFGILAHELFAGQRPFAGSGAVALAAIVGGAPAGLPPRAPPWLHELTTHCLAREPRDRPGSARSLRDQLERNSGSLSMNRAPG